MAHKKHFNPREVANIMYEYLVAGRSLKSVVERYDNLTETDVANIFKPYGLSCDENMCGAYNKVQLRNGRIVKVTKNDIVAYVASNKDESGKQTLEAFMSKNRSASSSMGKVMNYIYIAVIAIIIVVLLIMF